MDTCLNCGGAILEPGKAYGWVGKICTCPVHPSRMYQNPASNPLRPEELRDDLANARWTTIYPLPGGGTAGPRYTGSAAHLAPGARVRDSSGHDLGPAD